jgi:hypothetical protein
MKTHVRTPLEKIFKRPLLLKSGLLLLIIFTLSSCYKEAWYGRDGQAGNAYLALTWIDAKPEYIDAGTGDIPPVFEYGRYYPAYPGFYKLYYEGRFWNGQAYAFYAWEVEYEIWRMPGEPGGPYYNGANGADNYFSVECSPYGPWVYGPGYKSATLPEAYKLVEQSDDVIIVTMERETMGITITYRKVDGNHEQRNME